MQGSTLLKQNKMEKFTKILIGAGLNEREAIIYITLLKLNSAPASTIATVSKEKRPTVYFVLEQLKLKGLVSHFKRNNSTYYRALDPALLLEDHYNRFISLQSIVPDLTKLNAAHVARPQTTIFEGKEGMISLMEDTLKSKTDLLCWANLDMAADDVFEDYFSIYLQKRIKKKIKLKAIFNYSKKAIYHKYNSKAEFRETHLVSSSKFPFKNEINIYDDKIAIVSHLDKIGVIIQNKNIADTQRSIFDIGFEYAKLTEKSLLTKEDIEYLGDAIDFTLD